jgi:RNA ligase (TIGR02306 family)
MSEFHVEVVEVGKIESHPNADRLEITRVRDYPVIVGKGEYKEGDKAVYIPVTALVPTDDPRFAFLGDHNRIRAKKLRGIYSQGLLVKADPEWILGENVQEKLRIKKWEPEVAIDTSGEAEKGPHEIPYYTDIGGLRRYPDVLTIGEPVVICEKLHGSNGAFAYYEDRIWARSHRQFKKEDPNNMWWRVIDKYDLRDKLPLLPPGLVFFGEVYGQVQDLRYGAGKGEIFLSLFDVYNIKLGRYYDYDAFVDLADYLEIPRVPELYLGEWSPDLKGLAEGPSTVPGAEYHVREGFVVRPRKERYDDTVGRVVLKLIGEGYLLRKE